MPKGRYYVTPGTVTVVVGEAIDVTGLTIEDRDRLAAQTRACLEAMLAEGSAS